MDLDTAVVRAPAAHRAVAAATNIVVGYFVARLVLRLTPLSPEVTYGGCLALATLLAFRAWQSRIELTSAAAKVHNLLASTTVRRADLHRVREDGRIEWHAGAARPARLSAEALRCPWWAFGHVTHDYALNRERVRRWHRVAR
ncbi:hypothetical protein [Intrasporangium sp.]|uniref:hypothetical protein n=1 Tax=Intrasporangium sp. TaxID=1925024 RepID=UPI003221B18D